MTGSFNPDLVNSIFEGVAAISVLICVRQILKDREVKGISWLGCIFMPVWSFWNIYFYSSLDQTWSFVAAASMAVAETVYFVLLIYYTRKPSPSTSKALQDYREIGSYDRTIAIGELKAQLLDLAKDERGSVAIIAAHHELGRLEVECGKWKALYEYKEQEIAPAIED